MTGVLARPAVPAARYGERIELARASLAGHGAAALLLGVGADLHYLTGYSTILTERLTMLVLPGSGPAALVAPRLEAMAAGGCPAAAEGFVEIASWGETEDPYRLVGGRLATSLAGVAGDARILVNGDLWAMHVLRLQDELNDREFGLATVVLREQRMTKDADEVALLRLAARAADRALLGVARGRLVGRTEADVSREIRDRLVDEGHDLAEFAIVASGPNSASPHHHPGERRIAAGEPIVLDIGGTYGGYCSDTTRTIWVAGPDGALPATPEFLAIYELVRQAAATATAAARPGIACGDLDAAARDIIAAGGFGSEFLHRVGHGIGLETHEEPYLVAGNADSLREGVAFSIEPGIYIEGRHGVRIEDIVVCGPDGPDVLNEVTRDLLVVSG